MPTFRKVEKEILKEKAPENSLSIYLTNKNIGNIDIYAKTGIPTSELSRLRSGKISAVPANKLYLISLVSKEPIGKIVEAIYPKLKLAGKNTVLRKPKGKFTNLGNLLISEHYEVNSLKSISAKTGIKLPRLTDLIKKDSAIILAHELYLIELAIGVTVGSYFNKLFSELQLNDREFEEKLRIDERAKKN